MNIFQKESKVDGLAFGVLGLQGPHQSIHRDWPAEDQRAGRSGLASKGRLPRSLELPPPPWGCGSAAALWGRCPCAARGAAAPLPSAAAAPVLRCEAPPPLGPCAAAAAVAGVWRGRRRRAVQAPPGPPAPAAAVRRASWPLSLPRPSTVVCRRAPRAPHAGGRR